jgi:hypothetical protein
MKMWGSGCVAISFLTSALDGGKWSVSCPGSLTVWVKEPHMSIGWEISTIWSSDNSCIRFIIFTSEHHG